MDYKEDNIFNADETALFWKLEPKKTLAKERQTEKKKSKDRVTVIRAPNRSGRVGLNDLPDLRGSGRVRQNIELG